MSDDALVFDKPAPGFASSMLSFFGGGKKAPLPPMSEEERQEMIERYIREVGVTHCPPKLAHGYEGALYGVHLT